jgi:hypothetical protein
MILPSKHLKQERALLTVGAQVLRRLRTPKTVSALWDELSKEGHTASKVASKLTFDWFVLSLDLLFTLGAIELKEGRLTRAK